MDYPAKLNAPIQLKHACSDQDILACYPVMRQLRPHLRSAEEFLQQAKRQGEQGYCLLAAWRGEQVLALAGYRLQENLVHGRFLYVDDLVTLESARRHRLGQQLLDKAADIARQQHCDKLVLDTALGNSLAQRFYFRQGMLAAALRFNLELGSRERAA
jgi:ribosomal protein S18 acetylase RimI-like enzyme